MTLSDETITLIRQALTAYYMNAMAEFDAFIDSVGPEPAPTTYQQQQPPPPPPPPGAEWYPNSALGQQLFAEPGPTTQP